MFVIPKWRELKPHRDIPEWQVSDPIPVSFFAGTALTFIIEADADAPDVHAAVERVLSLGDADRLAVSAPVFEHYRVFLEASHLAPLDITTPMKVWQYVTPTAYTSVGATAAIATSTWHSCANARGSPSTASNWYFAAATGWCV